MSCACAAAIVCLAFLPLLFKMRLHRSLCKLCLPSSELPANLFYPGTHRGLWNCPSPRETSNWASKRLMSKWVWWVEQSIGWIDEQRSTKSVDGFKLTCGSRMDRDLQHNFMGQHPEQNVWQRAYVSSYCQALFCAQHLFSMHLPVWSAGVAEISTYFLC